MRSAASAGLALLAACRPATPRTEMAVVGLLTLGSESLAGSSNADIQDGLRELGWVEGQNLVLESRFADGRVELLPALAADLIGRGARVIFAPDGQSALAARAAGERVPIVAAVSDPLALGLVASLNRPGGSVTGLSLGTALVAGKRLDLLREVAGARRVAVLWYAPNPFPQSQLREIRDAAVQMGIDLREVGVQGPNVVEFEAALARVAAERPDAVFVINSPDLNPHGGRILEFLRGSRLPSIGNRREWVAAGGLMAYSVNVPAVHRRAAVYVDKILRGAQPADLPVEQPTAFDFVVNLKTVQALGLTIPQSVLNQVTELIQ